MKFGGGRIGGGGCVHEGGFVAGSFAGFGQRVRIGVTRASSFLPFLIKFLEASLEFCLLLELVFPDLDYF